MNSLRLFRKLPIYKYLNTKLETTNSKYKHMDSIVWMDLEMTGLDVEKNKILEVSCLITDKNLNITAEAPTQCIFQPESELKLMDEWCKKHLEENGLINSCRNSSLKIEDAEELLLKFLKSNISERTSPLAGNTVYMDRLFIMKYMPKVNEYLHYRIIDVSSIKEICKRWNYPIYKKTPIKKLSHRSLEDIKETIEELKYYKDNFFICS